MPGRDAAAGSCRAIARNALGQDSFTVLTVGFDQPVDTPAADGELRTALRHQRSGLALPQQPGQETITALMDRVGFLYQPSPRGYDHTVQVTILDRDGRVWRQVYGEIFPTPQLVEPLKDLVFNRPVSETGLLGQLGDRVRLFCTVYDAQGDRYIFDYSLFAGIFIGVLVLGSPSSGCCSSCAGRPAGAAGMSTRGHHGSNAMLRLLARFERPFSRWFAAECNPFHHLGALTIYFFWIILVSGIYLFLFYDTSVSGAWLSLERITHEQWYAGGVMRSLHRYASDAAIITMLLHMSREFLRGRYRGVRWYSWFTGVPLLWLVFIFGITGYWMVWDELAQYVAVSSARLLDWLPVFSDPMVRNFLTNETVNERFFTLMAFIHLVGLPIGLVLGPVVPPAQGAPAAHQPAAHTDGRQPHCAAGAVAGRARRQPPARRSRHRADGDADRLVLSRDLPNARRQLGGRALGRPVGRLDPAVRAAVAAAAETPPGRDRAPVGLHGLRVLRGGLPLRRDRDGAAHG
jgi:hypothetical protein